MLQAIAGSLPSFDRPVLILRARYDPVLTMSRARWLREALPQARLEVVSRAGHFLQEDQPERVASLLVDFLTEGRTDSPPPRPRTQRRALTVMREGLSLHSALVTRGRRFS